MAFDWFRHYESFGDCDVRIILTTCKIFWYGILRWQEDFCAWNWDDKKQGKKNCFHFFKNLLIFFVLNNIILWKISSNNLSFKIKFYQIYLNRVFKFFLLILFIKN